MKTLTFENKTHWRTSDFQRLVRAAREAVGYEAPLGIVIEFGKRKPIPWIKMNKVVGHTKRPVPYQRMAFQVMKRGPKDPHPIAMLAMAASYAVKDEVTEDTTLLAFSDVYYLANYFAYLLARHRAETEELSDEELGRMQKFRSNGGEITCPSWIAPEKLFVAKYRDPKKDATYLSFLKKKEVLIKKLDKEIKDLEGLTVRTKKKIATRRRKKSAAEKTIQAAKARRS